jgi:phage anti-repressor protein
MQSLDEMSANDAIALYYEKHSAISKGDMMKLLELKNKYSELFDKQKDVEMRDMIEHIQIFQDSERYKDLRKIEIKKTLSVIYNDKMRE